MKQTIFIGQAPSSSTRGSKTAFGDSQSGRRLAQLMGLTLEEMHERFEFANLVLRYPGPGDSNHPRGDHFPMATARRKAARMQGRLAGRTVVLVGKNVRDAFRLLGEYFETGVAFLPRNGAFTYFVIPHPSGISRWWNQPANVERARRFFEDELLGARSAGNSRLGQAA